MERPSTCEKRAAGLWETLAAAIVALMRKSGNSLHHSPLPELREAVRDWQLAAD
jgi:hypothetical protein